VTDSFAVVRNILMHIAAGVLVEETSPAAEALLVEEVSETLADLLQPSSGAVERATNRR
jgi:hypothetical protein